MGNFDYKKSFDQHIEDVRNIKSRILELKEFNNQWSEIFDKLKERTGKDCAVTINNHLLYRTYMADKFQVLIGDVHSVLDGQLIDQHTIIKDAKYNLKVHPVEYFADKNKKVDLIRTLGQTFTEEQIIKINKRFSLAHAQREHETMKECMHLLFPNIKDNFQITDSDQKDLYGRVKELVHTVEATRNVVNHKHQNVIKMRNMNKGDLIDIQKIDEVIKEYTEIVTLIAAVHHQSSYGWDSSFNYEATVADAIDLILFGSMQSALKRLGILGCDKEQFPDELKYHFQFRKHFYNSENIFSLVHGAQ